MTEAYDAVLAREGLDAFVLTSEAAVQHATGVRLYTQRLIPERPVVAVLRPSQPPVVVACALEEDQLLVEHPGLALRLFREFGDDPWRTVAGLLREAARVVVEDGMPAAWLEALRARLPGAELRVSYDLPLEPRLVKCETERGLFAEACRAAERALAAGAALVRPKARESEVAGRIAATFANELGARATEVAGTCVAPQNNRSMHHLSDETPLPDTGPVRLGIVGRLDGYWVLLTRMLLLGEDWSFVEAYRRYLACYEETMAELVTGAEARGLYEDCRRRAASLGFELTTLKVGHGTGLSFRERPWLSPFEDLTLRPGMVLAYDYALEDDGGRVLHVEDRVLVSEDGPRRLSDLWDLQDLAAGHTRAAEAP